MTSEPGGPPPRWRHNVKNHRQRGHRGRARDRMCHTTNHQRDPRHDHQHNHYDLFTIVSFITVLFSTLICPVKYLGSQSKASPDDARATHVDNHSFQVLFTDGSVHPSLLELTHLESMALDADQPGRSRSRRQAMLRASTAPESELGASRTADPFRPSFLATPSFGCLFLSYSSGKNGHRSAKLVQQKMGKGERERDSRAYIFGYFPLNMMRCVPWWKRGVVWWHGVICK